MKCHFVYEAYGTCANQGTECAPCGDQWCDHPVNPVCEFHKAWLEGYMEACYHMWEAADPEGYDPEDFSIMNAVLAKFLRMENHYQWDEAQGTYVVVEGVNQ